MLLVGTCTINYKNQDYHRGTHTSLGKVGAPGGREYDGVGEGGVQRGAQVSSDCLLTYFSSQIKVCKRE